LPSINLCLLLYFLLVVYCLAAAIAQDKQAGSRPSVLHTSPVSPQVSFLSFSFMAGLCVCVCVCVCLFVCFLKLLSLYNCCCCCCWGRFFFRVSFAIQGVLILLSYGVVCRVHTFVDYCRSAMCMVSWVLAPKWFCLFMAWVLVRGSACFDFASSVYRLMLRVKDLGFASFPINVVVAFFTCCDFRMWL
jgi:hypothetical protein